MHYALNVVLEVGRRAFTDSKSGRQVFHEFHRDYGFAPSLASIYRYRDLFEALSMGLLAEHEPKIAEMLHAQPAFVLTFDATQSLASYKLYRAVDFLSGFCLSTLLVPEGSKAQLSQWRQELYQRFGRPDYQVSDGESALHPDPQEGPVIRHQDCWFHVLDNVFDALLADWRAEAKQFLQQTRYRKVLTPLLQDLESLPLAAWPPHGEILHALVEFFLSPPVSSSSGFEEKMALRLAQFQETRTLLNNWERTLKGHCPTGGSEDPRLTHYRHSKAQLPLRERTDYFQHEIFTTDPFFQAFRRFKALVDEICTDRRLKVLLGQYKAIHNEFQTLRSWLLEAVIRRNTASEWSTLPPQTASEARLHLLLERSTARARAELAKIPGSLHTWRWKGPEHSFPLEEKAARLLQRIITRWTRKPASTPGFRKGAEILARQQEFLLTFFQHPAIPVSNQALESDHGQLKKLWRQSAGGQEQAYTLVYHGHSASMARNCVRGPGELSPLEILGFPWEVIEHWYYTCPPARLEVARETMTTVRRPRRLRLQAARQSLQEAFKGSERVWLEWAAQRLDAYLAQQAR